MVAGAGDINAHRQAAFDVEVRVQPPRTEGTAIGGRLQVSRLHQPRQRPYHGAIDGRDQVFDLGELALLRQRLQLAGQVAGDLLDRFGVENLGSFGQRTERSAQRSRVVFGRV